MYAVDVADGECVDGWRSTDEGIVVGFGKRWEGQFGGGADVELVAVVEGGNIQFQYIGGWNRWGIVMGRGLRAGGTGVEVRFGCSAAVPRAIVTHWRTDPPQN